jgi:hypothetical protein
MYVCMYVGMYVCICARQHSLLPSLGRVHFKVCSRSDKAMFFCACASEQVSLIPSLAKASIPQSLATLR